jgi:hypothetical protein
MTVLLATGYPHEAQRGDTECFGIAQQRLANWLKDPERRSGAKQWCHPPCRWRASARGGVSGTTALVAKVARQLRELWQGRSSASATD